jgi:four helix bundle protein
MELIDATYTITKMFPDYEKFGLVSQMNRCAVSIASNIAEGTSKSTDKHFLKYLETSLGSAFEWETQLIVCKRQNYIEKEMFTDLEKQVTLLQSKISNFMNRFE